MVENHTGGVGLPWPESYEGLLARIREAWGVQGEIYLVRQLSAGKSGALVYTADITTAAFAGQAILKLDHSVQSHWNETNEADRHRRAIETAPDFAAKHLPHLIHSLHHGEKIASLSTIAAGGLEYVAAWYDCPHERQLNVARRMSRDTLDGWNRDYRIADGMQMPKDLLRKWLGYRMHPEEGRIYRFVADKCGLAPEEPSFVFEGHWHPNPLAFAAGTRTVPDHLRLRAVIGNQHGDLHGDNLLVSGPRVGDSHYHLIDLAMYEDDQFLFFDHAYLELSYLLRAREEADWSRWNAILHCLSQQPESRDTSALKSDDLGLIEMVGAVRNEVPGWMERHESNRIANMDSQVRLARVGAGLSFTNKLMPAVTRQMAFLYAASNLRDYLQFHGVDWPKHGPPLELVGKDGSADSEGSTVVSVSAAPPSRGTGPASAETQIVPRQSATPKKLGKGRGIALGIAAAFILAIAIGVWGWQYWSPSGGRKTTASAEQPAPAEAPSIVVLPFENLDPGDANDMLAIGVTSTLTAALSQIPELQIISRRSAMNYKGRDMTPRQIAKELDVRYVLYGSVRRAGENLRIAAELIDGETGRVVWGEKYRRKADDLLAVEDEIALKVMVHMQVKLTEGQQAAERGEETKNLEAYLLFVRAQEQYRTYTKRGMVDVRRLARQIQTLDPNFHPAYILEAASHVVDARLGYADAAVSLKMASGIFEKVAALDGKLSVSEKAVILVAKATIDQNAGRFDKAISDGNKALALAPNNADVLAAFGMILYFAGDYDRSISMFQRTVRLHPAYPSWYTLYLARSYIFEGDTAAGIKWAQNGKTRAESDLLSALCATNLVFAYYEAGRFEDAKREAAEIRRFMPTLSMEAFLKHQHYQNAKDKERLVDALKQSGLP